MSKSQRVIEEEAGKISKDSKGRNLESALLCSSVPITSRAEKARGKPVLPIQSDGSIIKTKEQTGLKQKLVNKVKSWSKDNKHQQNPERVIETDIKDISLPMENLHLNISNDMLYPNSTVRARDSLENIIAFKNDKTASGDTNYKSFSNPSSSHQNELTSVMLHSERMIDNFNTSSTLLAWDPWNKRGRKNKKEKKRSEEKLPNCSKKCGTMNSPVKKPKMEESRSISTQASNETQADPNQDNYQYKPYKKVRKCVQFVNEVAVMYFTPDDIITETTEPLKKELDQQIRNKEMRRGHIPCTLTGKKQFDSDYMSAWFRK